MFISQFSPLSREDIALSSPFVTPKASSLEKTWTALALGVLLEKVVKEDSLPVYSV